MIVNLDSKPVSTNCGISNFVFSPHFLLLSPENGSNLVIFAITCQNNLCPAGAAVPPHWIVKQLRQRGAGGGELTAPTQKILHKKLTLLYNCCTAVFKQRRPSFEKTVHGSQKWCQLVPGSVGGYLEAVYRKTHFDSDFEHKSFSCKGGRFDKLQPIIGLGIRKHAIHIFRCTNCWCLQEWSHTIGWKEQMLRQTKDNLW